jgi:hypothetical protein
VTPGQYDIHSAIGVVDTQGEIDLQTVAKFCRQSNPTKNLQNAKFNIEPGLHVFEVHLQGRPNFFNAQKRKFLFSCYFQYLNEITTTRRNLLQRFAVFFD